MISAHDYRVARCRRRPCGGEVDAGSRREWLLTTERRLFVELLKTPETQARIRHMVDTGKPLRNQQKPGGGRPLSPPSRQERKSHESNAPGCLHRRGDALPVGRKNRIYAATRPDDLLAQALRAVVAQVPAPRSRRIGDVICGCAMPEAEQG